MAKATSVEDYIEKNAHFKPELERLRKIVNTTELEETLKWSAPVYTLKGKNVLGLAAFKQHFTIWFFNGVFLKDEAQLLVNTSEKTKALRQMRFNSMEDINEHTVLQYVKEAIENQKLGKELIPEKTSKTIVLPLELKQMFENDKTFKKQFEKLTPGKQREYAEHITSAKREATKWSRIEKIKPMIAKGLGLYDKYKNC